MLAGPGVNVVHGSAHVTQVNPDPPGTSRSSRNRSSGQHEGEAQNVRLGVPLIAAEQLNNGEQIGGSVRVVPGFPWSPSVLSTAVEGSACASSSLNSPRFRHAVGAEAPAFSCARRIIGITCERQVPTLPLTVGR